MCGCEGHDDSYIVRHGTLVFFGIMEITVLLFLRLSFTIISFSFMLLPLITASSKKRKTHVHVFFKSELKASIYEKSSLPPRYILSLKNSCIRQCTITRRPPKRSVKKTHKFRSYLSLSLVFSRSLSHIKYRFANYKRPALGD